MAAVALFLLAVAGYALLVHASPQYYWTQIDTAVYRDGGIAVRNQPAMLYALGLGPAKLPQDVVVKVNAEVNKALRSPDLRKKLGDQGLDISGSTPEQFAKLIREDIAKWGKVVKESGAKID